MNLPRISALILGLSLLLASCGGGSTPTPTPPPAAGDLFTDANAYKGDLAGAKIVTPAEFETQVKSGEIELETLEKRDARYNEAQKKIKADLDFLKGIPDAEQSEDVKTLLSSKVDLPTMPDGNYVLSVKQSDGSSVKVVTLGTPAMTALIVDSYKRADSLDGQLEAYRSGFDLAPEAARSGLPTPDSLRGKTLADILAARDSLDTALEKVNNLDGVTELSGASLSSTALDVGDQGTDCPRAAGGIFRNFAWPLKNFQTPIKQQGMRGSCWAFAVAAALESREKVVRDSTVNLSEQFIVNKVKREWGASDYGDNGGAEWTLDTAVNKGFAFPLEQYWPYNPAYGRPGTAFDAGVEGTLASYKGACVDFSWSCSESAHQSALIGTAVDGKNFRGYFRMVPPAGAVAVAADKTTTLWHNLWSNSAAHRRLKTFPLNEIRNQLASGRVLISSFGVFKGFDGPDANGFVDNFSSTGGRGGHVTTIVGYLSAATVKNRLPNAPSDPNGFFVLKNSWGCSADGGYYYVPVNYVTRFFSDLSVLNMTGTRGTAWKAQQNNPGSQNAPSVEVKANPARVDLRVETDLAQFFSVSQPKVGSVNLKVSSGVDGLLYNGPWSTDPGALIGPSLKKTFSSVGTRTLDLIATSNNIDTKATLKVNVVNTPPTLELQTGGDPRQGEDYPITAVLKDLNEPDLNPLCAKTVWTVTAPDTLSSTTGCTVKVKFGAQGPRTVKASTTDSEGEAGSSQKTFNVLAPPVNPFPKIVSSGVYSREFVGSGAGTLRFCGSPAVPSGNTIDLRLKGCSFLIGQPTPPRYFGGVDVENPDKETLTYDWRLFVTNSTGTKVLYDDLGSSKTSFELSAYGNAYLSTDNCSVTVKVNAPDPSRSKGPNTVWSGKCTYYAGSIN